MHFSGCYRNPHGLKKKSRLCTAWSDPNVIPIKFTVLVELLGAEVVLLDPLLVSPVILAAGHSHSASLCWSKSRKPLNKNMVPIEEGGWGPAQNVGRKSNTTVHVRTTHYVLRVFGYIRTYSVGRYVFRHLKITAKSTIHESQAKHAREDLSWFLRLQRR